MSAAGGPDPRAVAAELFEPQHPGMYVVLKRDLFYRPKAMGYTGILAHAGIYTPEEARYHEDRISGVSVMRWEDAPEFTSACFDDLARVHLQQQRDAARTLAMSFAAALAASEARAAAAVARAEVAERRTVPLMQALLAAAPHHQGAHGIIGEAIASALGVPHPIRVPDLMALVDRLGIDPPDVWPWEPRHALARALRPEPKP